MKFIYVLEDDERSQKDLLDTIKLIDPKLHIRFFPTLAVFHQFLKAVMKEGALALATHGEKHPSDTSEEEITPSENHELRLMIAKYEIFGKRHMNLIGRAHQFLHRRKVRSPEGALILTAFDSPDFDIKLAEDRIINNVIFKPFDKLILKQHIEYALTGHHPVKSDTVATVQLSSTLEMLKEVSINSLSEVGFTTINNHEIKSGAFTKYYSEAFKTDDKRSVYAYCDSSKEIGKDEFLCHFLFYGIDNKQIAQIRRHVLQKKSHQTTDLKQHSDNPLRVLILDEDMQTSSDIKNFLTDKMKSLQLFVYNHYGQFLSDLADKDTVNRQELPHEFDIVIANHDLFYVEKEKRWEQILQYMKDRKKKHGITNETLPVLYMISKHKILPDEVRNLSTWVKELFFSPLDRSYLLKRLLSGDPRFGNKETTALASILEKIPVKVANPVEITEISEAGLVLKYYRAMSIGAFREFILWRPQELELPEIIGTVNFTEKDKGGGDYYHNHFVFFGMKDYFLKHIRLWLRDAYIKTKEKE